MNLSSVYNPLRFLKAGALFHRGTIMSISTTCRRAANERLTKMNEENGIRRIILANPKSRNDDEDTE